MHSSAVLGFVIHRNLQSAKQNKTGLVQPWSGLLRMHSGSKHYSDRRSTARAARADSHYDATLSIPLQRSDANYLPKTAGAQHLGYLNYTNQNGCRQDVDLGYPAQVSRLTKKPIYRASVLVTDFGALLMVLSRISTFCTYIIYRLYQTCSHSSKTLSA